MKKYFFTLSFLALFFGATSVVTAQDDRHKGEFYGGYQFLRTNGINVSTGFTGAGTFNISDMMGVKGDFGYSTRDGLNLTTFQGGIQFKNNKTEGSKMRPFAHAMGGMFRAGGFGGSVSDFGVTFGAGVDYKATDRISIRVGQADFMKAFGDLDSNLFRFSAGIVFH